MPPFVFFHKAGDIFVKDDLCVELMEIAIPAALALAADPVASLIDTAFIGHLGPVELAAVGVSIAVFNQVSKIAIFPIVSVTTSLVAQEDTIATLGSDDQAGVELLDTSSNNKETDNLLPKLPDSAETPESQSTNRSRKKGAFQKRYIPSAASAMVVGCILGLVQTCSLILAAEPILEYMGVHKDSPMLIPAQRYLTLRSLGAPAVLLSLAMQGVFRGIKNTRTPLFATVLGDAANIILDPIFIFVFRLNVSGAAIAHVISQYLISLVLMWQLVQEVDVLPPSIWDLQLGRFLKSGFMLLMRVIAATFCVTLAASLAARDGPTSMAAFQVCLQIWLATSLLADGLAVSGQAILAGAFAKGDFDRAEDIGCRVLQYAFVLGAALAVVLYPGLLYGAGLFTDDDSVLKLISVGVPFVAATQPINVMAFVFDGVNYGASDFAYSSYSMILVAIISLISLYKLALSYGFVGIWCALTLFMALRCFAGFVRIGFGIGPWSFRRRENL
ncbi:Protein DETOXIFICATION 42 [Linum perenne]